MRRVTFSFGYQVIGILHSRETLLAGIDKDPATKKEDNEIVAILRFLEADLLTTSTSKLLRYRGFFIYMLQGRDSCMTMNRLFEMGVDPWENTYISVL